MEEAEDPTAKEANGASGPNGEEAKGDQASK